MILTDLRRYLEGHGQATLSDIAQHLDAEPEAVRGMLEHWMRKGRVRRHLAGSGCGGCNGCQAGRVEIYEWGGNGGAVGQGFPPSSCSR